MVIACILLRSIVIYLLTRTYDRDYFFHRAVAIDQVGTLYRLVTPAGLGSHVMETYVYRKQGISISSALSILAMYSIAYQIVLILYNTMTLAFKSYLIADIGAINFSFSDNVNFYIPLWLLVTAGYVINVSVIGVIFLISYWNGFYRFIDGPIGRLLKKVKLVKDIDSYHEKLLGARDNFRANLKRLLRNYPVLLTAIVCFFLYITLSYSSPYIVGLALGNTSSNANFWDSVLLSNFHQMITCIIPIPGNAFSSELFFLRLFYPGNEAVNFYQSEEIARSSLLLWRSLMFIFPLAISLLYTLIYHPRKKKQYVKNQEN